MSIAIEDSPYSGWHLKGHFRMISLMTPEELKKNFALLTSCEEKSRLALDCMRAALSQDGRPKMSDFWAAKQLCMEAFKGDIGVIKRSAYWKEFIELTEEAKRLKVILDEETNFSCEQIERAVEELKREFHSFDALLQTIPPITLSKGCKTLQRQAARYVTIQRQLSLLKSLVARYQSLRNEAIHTEMRMGHRNRLLKRLSGVGDDIFALRKQLVEEVSDLFVADVARFIDEDFPSLKETTPFKAKREIQLLQESAKKLSLHRTAFAECRTKLSKSWDALQEGLEGNQDALAENQAKIAAEIDSFLSQPPSDVRAMAAEAKKYARRLASTSLAPEAYKHLLAKLKRGEELLIAQGKEALEKSKREEREKVAEIKVRLETLIEQPNEEEVQHLFDEVTAYAISDNDRLEIQHLFAEVEEATLSHREDAAMKEDAQDVLGELLLERRAVYRKFKDELALFRKEMESSHFDLEKAMIYRDLYEAGKSRLSRVEAALSRLEKVCKL